MTRRRVVHVSRDTIDGMVAHARRARPRECCGVLLGTGGRVACAIPMRNAARGRTRDRVDPAEPIALRRALREIAPSVAIIGVYHSHPRGPARPSETDVIEALYPDWVHLVIGLGGARPAVRAFTIAGGRVRALAIRRIAPAIRSGVLRPVRAAGVK